MRHARHIDDHAVLVLQHMRQHRLHGVERAVDVEREGLLDERVIDLEKLGAPDCRARRVEEKVHRAERGDRARHHVVDFFARGDVGRERERLAAGAIDGRRSVARALLVDVGADDVGPFAGEDQRGGAADAARRAGDEDRLSDEIRRPWHLPLLVSLLVSFLGAFALLRRAFLRRLCPLAALATIGNGPSSRRGERSMPRMPIEYRNASAEVRAVFDDIKRTRQVDDVNNFWKYLADDPALLARTWQSVKEVMAPGALDPLTKEMVYLAVSVTNGCAYCIASHTAAARKAGMSEAMFGELMAVVGMANETNRLANGYRVPVDPAFDK